MRGLLIVGHGSEKSHYGKVMEIHKERISRTGIFDEVEISYVARNRKPTPDEAVRRMKSETIYVVPVLMSKGIHFSEDLPAFFNFELGQREGEFEGKKIIICDPIGEDYFVTLAIINAVIKLL